ncbi:unnamed protein product, partial [Oppiella nova]
MTSSEAWSWELGGFGNTLVAQFNPVRFIPGPVFAVIDGVTGYSEEEAENALSRYEIFGDFNRTLPETDYFSDRGLEYNLNRVPIGGSDFSTHPYSYDDDHKGDFELKYWNLTADDHNYKIPYMKAALQVSPYKNKVKFFGSPWSAPAWMKNNSQLNHGGYLIGEPGGAYYKTYANYFVKFLDAYKQNDLNIWGITIQNEPGAGSHPDYSFNSMGFTPELQRDFLKKDLGPILEAAGYGRDKLDVMICDDQRNKVHLWADTILKDKDAAKYVSGTAFHFYSNKPENVGNLDKTHEIDPNRYILNTEASHNVPTLGFWPFLEDFSKDIIIDLNHWTNGWVHWNMALNLTGGPDWSGSAGAPIIVNATGQEYYKNPDFYGMAHFSKFVSPDSVRLELREDKPVDKVLTIAFERPDGGVVVIILNPSNDEIDFTINESTNRLTHVIKAH